MGGNAHLAGADQVRGQKPGPSRAREVKKFSDCQRVFYIAAVEAVVTGISRWFPGADAPRLIGPARGRRDEAKHIISGNQLVFSRGTIRTTGASAVICQLKKLRRFLVAFKYGGRRRCKYRAILRLLLF
jgi:hypothetical protein